MTEPAKATISKRRGRWKPGESGNPAGRKPGIANTTRLRQLVADELDEVIGIVITAAKAGDIAACRLLIERVLPAVKPIEQPVAMHLPVDAGLVAQGEAVMAAVAEGILAPTQAGTLLTGLGSLAKLKETEELEVRIAALEAKTEGNL